METPAAAVTAPPPPSFELPTSTDLAVPKYTLPTTTPISALKAKDLEIADLKQRLQKLVTEKQRSSASLNAELTVYQNAVQEYTARHDQQAKELQSLRTELQTLKTQQTTSSDAEHKVSALQTENDKLKQTQTEIQNQLTLLQEENKQLKTAHATPSPELQSLQEENKRLKTEAISTTERIQQQQKEAQVRIDGLEQRIEKDKQNLKIWYEKTERPAIEAFKTEITRLQTEIERMHEQILDKDTKLRNMEYELNVYKSTSLRR